MRQNFPSDTITLVGFAEYFKINQIPLHPIHQFVPTSSLPEYYVPVMSYNFKTFHANLKNIIGGHYLNFQSNGSYSFSSLLNAAPTFLAQYTRQGRMYHNIEIQLPDVSYIVIPFCIINRDTSEILVMVGMDMKKIPATLISVEDIADKARIIDMANTLGAFKLFINQQLLNNPLHAKLYKYYLKNLFPVLINFNIPIEIFYDTPFKNLPYFEETDKHEVKNLLKYIENLTDNNSFKKLLINESIASALYLIGQKGLPKTIDLSTIKETGFKLPENFEPSQLYLE